MDTVFFTRFIREFSGRKILVGFSGGADSTALLLLLDKYKTKLNLDFCAVHFNHGLRAESDEEVIWCRDFCSVRRIDFTAIDLNVKENMRSGENLEAAARRLRLAQFSQLSEQYESSVVALGHHRDDRIENIFIRLFRGANVSGTTSMRQFNILDGLTLIRPLFNYSRAELEVFLIENGVTDWCEDESNRDNSFLRNYLRNKMLPEIFDHFAHTGSGVVHALDNLEHDALFIEQEAEKKYAELKRKHDVPVMFWLRLHPALRVRVLRLWLNEQLPFFMMPDNDFFKRFNQLLEDAHQERFGGELKVIELLDSYRIEFCSGVVNIDSDYKIINNYTLDWNWREQHELHLPNGMLKAELISPDNINFSLGASSVYFDTEKLPKTLKVRSWSHGDAMVPFGATSPIKLKKLFTDAKINSKMRHSYPVVADDNNTPLWLPRVRSSNHGRVDDKTIMAVCFSWTAN